VEELVNGLAEMLEFREAEAPAEQDNPDAPQEVADAADVGDTAVTALHHEQFVRALWPELCSLGLSHRQAFLLHRQRDEVMALVSHGCCSLRQLAELLEVSLSELASWLGQLPLPDNRIGELSGLSGREVINRRVSAERRLSRRLGVWNAD
jgi:hypothetical protein